MLAESVINRSYTGAYAVARLTLLVLIVLPVTVFSQAGSDSALIIQDNHHNTTIEIVSNEHGPMLPEVVLKLAEDEHYLLWIDLKNGRLSVLAKNQLGGLDVQEIIPVSIGKNGFGKKVEGDQKTPVGVYRLTSFLTDQQLPDFYGLGAYPLNYPNVIDRQARRTGSGIWLHGLPKDVTRRPLLDSDGCIVIDNQSLQHLQRFITGGITHMVLSDEPLAWVKGVKVAGRRAGLEQAFQTWKLAWQERDNDAYLAFYADDFSDFMRSKAQWSEYKARVNNSKSWIEVQTSNVSYYADLKNPGLVTVRYYQDYKSSNYQWRGWKEQLWRESDQGWQIIYEGNG